MNEMFSCYRHKEAGAAAVAGGPGVRRSQAEDWWRTTRTAAASAGRGRTPRRHRRRPGAAGAAAEVAAAVAAAASSPPPRRRREEKNAEAGLGFWIRAAGKGSAASGFGVSERGETMGSAVDEPRSREPSSPAPQPLARADRRLRARNKLGSSYRRANRQSGPRGLAVYRPWPSVVMWADLLTSMRRGAQNIFG